MPIEPVDPMDIRPNYLRALAPLTADLQSAHGTAWNWNRGGCFAFAEAYVAIFGGSLYGVCRHDAESDDFPVDHAIVRVSDTLFIDVSGPVDVLNLKHGTCLLSKDDEKTAWFEDDFLNDTQMQRLRDILQQEGAFPVPKIRANSRSTRR